MSAPLPPPSAGDVVRIAGVNDPQLRNLQVTQCYHELALAMRRLVPGGANWCTFATSASRQAGQTIRHEDLQNLIRERIAAAPVTPPLVRDLVAMLASDRGEVMRQIDAVLAELGPLKRSGLAVAAGNQEVFAEIGPLFAQFLSLFAALPAGTLPTRAQVDSFCDSLKPGEPPDGQDRLREAFLGYFEAAGMAPGKARAERLLHSNLLIGLHEQQRLQPQIRGALDGALLTERDVEDLLIAKLGARRGWIARLLDWLLPSRQDPMRALLRPLATHIKDVVRVVITDHLMTLTLPRGRVLRLGRDVPGEFPPDLRAIADAGLAALLRSVDPTGNSTAGSAAIDWSDFGERIHYIADLFRAFQDDDALFDPPFTDAQVAEIRAGRIPAQGPL